MPHKKAGQRVNSRTPGHSLLDACAPRLVPLCIGVALAAAGAQEEDAAAAHVLQDALGLIHISINLQNRHVPVSGQRFEMQGSWAQKSMAPQTRVWETARRCLHCIWQHAVGSASRRSPARGSLLRVCSLREVWGKAGPCAGQHLDNFLCDAERLQCLSCSS